MILLKQLEMRGYNVNDYDDFSVSELQLLTENQQLDMLISNSDGHKIYIKYMLSKLGKQKMEEISYELFEERSILEPETDQLMFIVLDEPNETIQKSCEHLYNNRKFYITIHNIRRLLFDITAHKLVPPHRPLSSDEMEDVMREHKITNVHQFPEISRFDPVALAIGLRPGQLCEIIRKSKTALVSKYYRICV